VPRRASSLVILALLSAGYSVLSRASVPSGTIEVVQAVQSLDGDVRLIAGKPTMVRIYLDSNEYDGQKVTGFLETSRVRTGETLTTQALNSVEFVSGHTDTMLEQHDDLAKSLNFVLPAAWTTSGQITLRLAKVLRDADKIQLPCAFCGATPKPATFFAAPPLKVKVIYVAYNLDGTSPLAEPSEEDYEAIKSWLQRAYPISQILISQDRIEAQPNSLKGPFTCDAVNTALAIKRIKEVRSHSVDLLTHYYGLVSDKYFFMRGCTSIAINPDPRFIASGPAGNPADYPNDKAISWDKSKTFAGWYAGHELAHTFGRTHPGKCGELAPLDSTFPFELGHLSNAPEKYIGIDMHDKADLSDAVVLPGLQWADMMTYCPNIWISGYTYTAIFDRLSQENRSSTTGPSFAPFSLQLKKNKPRGSARQYIDILISVNLTKATAHFEYVQKDESPYFELPDGQGEATIRTVNNKGGVIGSYHATVYNNTDLSPTADKTAVIRLSIPFSEKISSLELVLGSEIKASFSAGGERAAVSDLRARTAPELNPDEISMMALSNALDAARRDVFVSWKDAGEGVTYDVELSIDKGQTWSTIAARLSDHFLAIDPLKSHLSNGSDVVVRVTASDGFRSTAVETTTIKIKSLE
jgi:hypothetical protein